ncbi:MAG: nicotinate phosphoribosyltransferase [Thermoprotei archaeon]
MANDDWICSFEEIRSGLTTDVYLERMLEALRKDGKADTPVVAEFSGDLPDGYEWGVFSGLNEVTNLLNGRQVDVWALPEGSVFRSEDINGVEEPVMVISGPYSEFALFETAILGILSYDCGVSTAAARVKLAAGGAPVFAFGIRRMHPALAAISDRAAYIGGVDGFSGVAAGRRLGITPVGTMPHSFILIYGRQEDAWSAFDRYAPPTVPRILLCDTLSDEKDEVKRATQLLEEKLVAVRLDTPKSRRGDFEHIVREVRWELDHSGFKSVKIMVSGGLNEKGIRSLREAGADMFGVGTSIAAAKVVDFSMDLCEVEGKPVSKRGRFSGRKTVYRCVNCLTDVVVAWGDSYNKCPKCGGTMEPAMVKVMEAGRPLFNEDIQSIRSRSLKQTMKLGLNLDSA